MADIEKTIEKLTRNPETANDGLLVNELLQQFHAGAPLEYLRPLLLSADPELASSGAWIASELGMGGKPLLDVVASLLGHPDKRVRFWIIDCILLWADTTNGPELAGTIRLLGDPEKAVRWKAIGFLSRASTEQLKSALAWLAMKEPGSKGVHGLEWLLGAPGIDAGAIETMLMNPQPQMRKYAVAAAARLASKNRHPLIVASVSPDLEIAEFAADWASSL